MRLTHSGAILAALTISALAQDKPPIPRDTRASSVTALSAQKAQLTVRLTSAAAAVQLASIRTALNSMLTDVVLAVADGKQDPALTDHSEDELLKIFAVQLEGFIQQFKTTDEAEGARSLLGRIYVKLRKFDEAVRVLKDLDADRADQSDLLQVALVAGEVNNIDLTKSVDDWLRVVGLDGVVWDKRLDAVFVAVRLNKWDLAGQLLADTRGDAKLPADKAAVAVAEADLVSRLGITCIIPVNSPTKSTCFLVDPLVAAKLDANEVPIGSWRHIKTAPVPANYAEATKAADSAKRRDEVLRKSDLYKQLVADAAPGLRTLVALKDVDDTSKVPVDGTWAPSSDETLPPELPPVNVLAKALLTKAVYKYPGTDGARKAAIRLHADTIQIGDLAVAFDSDLIDGRKINSADLHGKVVLLDFFSVTDYDSIAERKVLAKMHQNYAALGLEIVSISLDEAANQGLVLAAVDGFDMKWPVVFDGKGPHADIATKYGVQAVPARLLIAADGTVFEDRAWHLSPDELEASILNAMAKPRRPLPAADTLYLAEKAYYGPQIHVNIAPSPDGTTNFMVNANVWVADAGYRLSVSKVEAKPDGVKVYLNFELQQWQTNADRQMLSVQVPVPVDKLRVSKFVKVYVDHKVAGDVVSEKPPAAPLLCKVIEVDPTSIAPMWPRIDIELVSTDSLPPEFTAVLTTDLLQSEYAVEVDAITHVDAVTEIKLRVTAKKANANANATAGKVDPEKGDSGSADDGSKERIRLVLPLGTEAGQMIDVLVASYNAATGEIGAYAVVNRYVRK